MKNVCKYIVCVVCVFLLSIGTVLTASALRPGDVLGWAEYTDTKVYINDAPIRAYSIEGELCIVAEDLAHYGFNIGYTDSTRTLYIRGVSRYKTAEQITPISDAGKAGTRAMPYLYTDIDTIMNKDAYRHTRVTAYNIGGYTCVRVEDITEYYTTRCVRDTAANEIRLYLNWEFTYETPEYDAMAETKGDYVILEFTQKDGEFFLTYTEGATLCLPYVKIGGREIAYGTQKTINPPADIIGAPHTLQAHEAIKRLFLADTNGGTNGNSTDGIYAEQFATYAAEEPEKAAILRERAGKLRDVLRVWYNGVLVDGIGVALPEYAFFRAQAYEWRFVFAEPYDKEAIETVRIELRLPEDEGRN